MRVTIRDVAREAGVSNSTVSRVLNNTCPVNEDKARRVVEAAERLGYTPDPVARSLLLRETGGIGVLLPFVSGEFFSGFLTGIDRCSRENGYYLLISSSHRSASEFATVLNGIYGRVDGLVIMAPEQGRFDRNHPVLSRLPVVFVNTHVDGKDFDVFNFANFEGAFQVTRHLINQGHRRMACIQGPKGSTDASERARGFRTALEQAGLPRSAGIMVDGDFTQEAGVAAVAHLLSLDKRPSAIVAANDSCAFGVLSALQAAGIAVPEQMAVAGFDDVKSARFSSPPLTTVRVPVYEIGVLAVERLVARIRSKESLDRVERVLDVDLILRESTEGSSAANRITRSRDQ